MTILYIFLSSNFSGAEIVIQRLIDSNRAVEPIILCSEGEFANRLSANGHEVVTESFFTSLNRRSKKQSSISIAIKVTKKILKINYQAIRIVKKNKIDIIHTNNVGTAFYLWPTVFLLRLFCWNKRCIWSNHDLVYPDKTTEYVARLNHIFYHKTLAVSEAVKRKYPACKNKIEVLYNGLDTSTFKNEEAKRLSFRTNNNLNDKNIAIGILGLIIERKGHLLLLDSFEILSQKYPNVILYIFGQFLPSEDVYKHKILKRLAEMKNDKIHLRGYTNNTLDVYAGLDIVLNCSLKNMSEPLGTTIYEAMACEKIVVASNTGGTPEIIFDKKDGFLFNPDDLESLTTTLDYVINNISNLNDIRYNARQKVIAKFSVEKMSIFYNNIIKNTIR